MGSGERRGRHSSKASEARLSQRALSGRRPGSSSCEGEESSERWAGSPAAEAGDDEEGEGRWSCSSCRRYEDGRWRSDTLRNCRTKIINSQGRNEMDYVQIDRSAFLGICFCPE